jgi:hypothetical protein
MPPPGPAPGPNIGNLNMFPVQSEDDTMLKAHHNHESEATRPRVPLSGQADA